MKKIILALVALVSLAGCVQPAVDTAERVDNETHVITKVLPDGGAVTCIAYSGGYGKAISCDWIDHNE